MPTANIGGVQIAYRDEGVGLPLVLVHAFPLSGAMWRAQIDALAQRYRVIVPDMRGFGSSQIVPGPASIDQYADDLAGLLDQLGLAAQPVVLGGLSMGGYIAFAFLRRYRERVRALILADTRPQPDGDAAREQREQSARLAEQQGPGAIADRMLPNLISAHSSDALRAELRSIIESNDRAGIAAAQRAMALRQDSTPLLSAIAVPTLVLVGVDDVLSPPDVLREMHQAITGSRLVVIERAGHVSNMEQPTAFNAALEEFLSELRAEALEK